MLDSVKVLVFAIVAVGISSSLNIIEPLDQPAKDGWNGPSLLNGAQDVSLLRSKREDIVKFLIDAVDDDIDKCGSPLQLQNDMVTVSVQSLSCIVQALVDSLNAGPGLLRKILDNLLKKRDLSAVSGMGEKLTRSEEECAMKAIVKEAMDVLREEHERRPRQKRRSHGNDDNKCAEIEQKIEDSMKEAQEKGKGPQRRSL